MNPESVAPGKGVRMPPVKVDPAKVKTFENAIAFIGGSACTSTRKRRSGSGFYKVGSGLKSITPKEAVDVCLCWGWIDAVRKRFDDKSYLQRYTRRRKRSPCGYSASLGPRIRSGCSSQGL
jgi:uncharacterized protein YdeI (YjbR/CyaY-like superfamily)